MKNTHKNFLFLFIFTIFFGLYLNGKVSAAVFDCVSKEGTTCPAAQPNSLTGKDGTITCVDDNTLAIIGEYVGRVDPDNLASKAIKICAAGKDQDGKTFEDKYLNVIRINNVDSGGDSDEYQNLGDTSSTTDYYCCPSGGRAIVYHADTPAGHGDDKDEGYCLLPGTVQVQFYIRDNGTSWPLDIKNEISFQSALPGVTNWNRNLYKAENVNSWCLNPLNCHDYTNTPLCVFSDGTSDKCVGDYAPKNLDIAGISNPLPQWWCGLGNCRYVTSNNRVENGPFADTSPSPGVIIDGEDTCNQGSVAGSDVADCYNNGDPLPDLPDGTKQWCLDGFASVIDPTDVCKAWPDADEKIIKKAKSSCKSVTDPEEQDKCYACECSGFDNVWTEIGCVEATGSGFVTRIFQIAVGIMGAVIIFRVIQIVVILNNPDPSKDNMGEVREIAISIVMFIIFIAGGIIILKYIGYDVLNIKVPIFG